MLRRLSIRNFAVIERLDLNFDSGLSVFTGETGAGKSIVIEALGFLMGARGLTDWIRSGAKRLEVEAEWDASHLPAGWAEKPGGEKSSFVLRRELDASGRSKASLNTQALTLSQLAILSPRLVDFHGQHEHQNLLKPASQMNFLDAFGGLDKRLKAVSEAHRAWLALAKKREGLKISEDERLRRIDLLKFQTEEIDAVDPQSGEEEELAEQLPRLKYADRLRSLASKAYGELYAKEASAQSSLREAEECLKEMADMDASLAETCESLARARETATEAAEYLARYREDSAENEGNIDELIGRQDKISKLKRKYGLTIEEVLAFRDRSREELSALENHAESMREVDLDLERAKKSLSSLCERLHKERRTAARHLGRRVVSEIRELGMPAAELSITVEMEEGQLSAVGSDRVEILIAPNPGESLKPLRMIASGGELSRVMLALKTVLARQDRVALMVFDEVDTGVGAAVGSCVGAKLAEIAGARQVFCVTHLPQVACCAGHHFQVAKSVSSGRTFTRVEKLEREDRIEAVARMLGGRKATAASRRHAKELMTSV